MAQGLDNPRGLAFGPDGMLYVVEAGRGGTSALCLPTPTGMGTRCYGASAAVTRITGPGVQQRVLIGLPSLAVPSGAEATGPQDIAFGFGRAFITVGSGGDPALLAPFRAANIPFGQLLQVSLQGVITPLVDVAALRDRQQPRADARGLERVRSRDSLEPRGDDRRRRQHAAAGGHQPHASPPWRCFRRAMVSGPGGTDIPMESCADLDRRGTGWQPVCG